MAQIPQDVAAYLDSVQPAKRRRDGRTMVDLMARVTGEPPVLNGTIVGFGRYRYRYESGRTGEAAAAAFAPRRAALTIYLPDGAGAHTEALERLGPHTTGVGCLNIKDLETVDLGVLESIVAASYGSVRDGTWTERARRSGAAKAVSNSPAPGAPGLPPKLGAPATRALQGAGYRRLDQLAGVPETDLLALHGFGPRGVRILGEALAAAGLEPLS